MQGREQQLTLMCNFICNYEIFHKKFTKFCSMVCLIQIITGFLIIKSCTFAHFAIYFFNKQFLYFFNVF